jgi:hypothetical protein
MASFRRSLQAVGWVAAAAAAIAVLLLFKSPEAGESPDLRLRDPSTIATSSQDIAVARRDSTLPSDPTKVEESTNERSRLERGVPENRDSIPDPTPTVHIDSAHLETYLQDSWINPTQRVFTSEELQALRAWAAQNSAVADQIGRDFLAKTDALGKDYLRAERHTGSVDTTNMSKEERDALPYMTKDWLRPVFFEFRGKRYRWVQLDLATDAPEVAELWHQKQAEIALARSRLREHVLSFRSLR